MNDTENDIVTAAASDGPVLIIGEEHSGKTSVARKIHDLSGRTGEFVEVQYSINIKSPENIQIFGHLPGALSGAPDGPEGALITADRGSLVLRHVYLASASAQKELLRFMQYGRFWPIGRDTNLPVDVRLMATAFDIDQCESLDHNLFWSLSQSVIRVRPLRERPDDIPTLCNEFLEAAKEGGLAPATCYIPNDEMEYMQGYEFPGNLFELNLLIGHAAKNCDPTDDAIRPLTRVLGPPQEGRR